MFRDKEIRSHAMYFTSSWPGGLYGTATLLGSRTGAPIAGAWMTMVYKGRSGMKEIAEKVVGGILRLKAELKKIPEIEIVGDP